MKPLASAEIATMGHRDRKTAKKRFYLSAICDLLADRAAYRKKPKVKPCFTPG